MDKDTKIKLMKPSCRLLLQACLNKNLDIIDIDSYNNSFTVKVSNKLLYFKAIQTPLNNQSARPLTKNKFICKKLFTLYNLPTPNYVHIYKKSGLNQQNINNIDKLLKKHKRIIAKPTNGMKSQNIFLDINTREKALEAFQNITTAPNKKYSGVLFEQFIPGDVYRLLFLEGNLIGALKREPGFIIGDGNSQLDTLINWKNKFLDQSERDVGRIKKDQRLMNFLKSQGIESLAYIPKQDEKVFVDKDFSNLETVTEVTKEVNPKIIYMISKMLLDVNLNLIGVDVISPDISSEEFSIIEINAEPSLDFHHYPDYGEAIDVATKIINAVIKQYTN
ncbi:MAG: hypothetical protein KatS3mg085_339 [Candidatus Dojkabacteria bacterium]|nr:MAG: hypothetical protein KatS3mg085_339 [Candidatus Dojkabacteria bacterium]